MDNGHGHLVVVSSWQMLGGASLADKEMGGPWTWRSGCGELVKIVARPKSGGQGDGCKEGVGSGQRGIRKCNVASGEWRGGRGKWFLRSGKWGENFVGSGLRIEYGVGLVFVQSGMRVMRGVGFGGSRELRLCNISIKYIYFVSFLTYVNKGDVVAHW